MTLDICCILETTLKDGLLTPKAAGAALCPRAYGMQHSAVRHSDTLQ